MQVTAEDNAENVRYSKSKSFSEQVDDVLNGADTSNSHLKVMDTPQLLQKAGLPNLPILITAKHIKTITSYSGDSEANYHGLDAEIVKKLPEYISSPVMIADSLTRDDSIVIITEALDSNNNPVIAAIMLNGTGRLDNKFIDANIMTSAYGKNNFQSFINRIADRDSVIYWNRKKSQNLSVNLGVQFPDVITNLDSDIIIRQTRANVNSNSTQNFEKDASRAEKSSDINERTSKADTRKRLEDRVSGDELLDAQDLIEVVKEKGGEVDENGYITLYHRTSSENADKIRSTGFMKAKEDGLFFSTAKEGYASGYGDTVVEFSIPAEKLILDDIFDNEAHLRFPLKQTGVKSVKAYLVDESVLDKDGKSDINIRYSFNTSKTGVANDALSTYSEELSQLILQKGDYIIDSFAKLEEIVNLAFDSTAEKATAYFGIINPQILEKIKNSIPNLPKEIEGMLFKEGREYSIATTLDAIRHIVDDKSLSREDVIDYLDRFADTILEFDSVSFDYYTDSYKNKIPGLLFKKQYPDGTLISFNLVSKKKRSMILQSLYMDKADYQKKKLAKTLLMKNNLSHTPKARVGQTSNNSIPQKLDLSTEKSNINDRSSKTGRDTVEMSRGEIAKFRPNYTSDKTFNKRKISEALNDISLISKLPANVRNELVQSLWKCFNEHRAYDIYSKVMTEQIYATVMQETGFELERLDTKDSKDAANILKKSKIS